MNGLDRRIRTSEANPPVKRVLNLKFLARYINNNQTKGVFARDSKNQNSQNLKYK